VQLTKTEQRWNKLLKTAQVFDTYFGIAPRSQRVFRINPRAPINAFKYTRGEHDIVLTREQALAVADNPLLAMCYVPRAEQESLLSHFTQSALFALLVGPGWAARVYGVTPYGQAWPRAEQLIDAAWEAFRACYPEQLAPCALQNDMLLTVSPERGMFVHPPAGRVFAVRCNAQNSDGVCLIDVQSQEQAYFARDAGTLHVLSNNTARITSRDAAYVGGLFKLDR